MFTFLFITFVVKSIIVTKNDIGEKNGFLGIFFYPNHVVSFERKNFHLYKILKFGRFKQEKKFAKYCCK